MMWRNYLKTAVRNLSKRRLYTVINITGLATGIACFILLGLYLQNEWTYEQFQVNATQLYRIRLDYGERDQPITHTALNPNGLGPAVKGFPEVKAMTRVYPDAVMVKYGDKAANEKRFIYADVSFFNMFSFPLISGNAATVLGGPGMVVLSASMAEKYFGTTDAVGKTLLINDKGYQVTGVAKDAPANTHLKFDFVASYSSLGQKENWNAPNYYTYVQLADNATAGGLHKRLQYFIKEQLGAITRSGVTFDFVPEPLTGIHLHSIAGNSTEAGGDVRYNYILTVVAILLLLIACINFMNLATARSADRSREIGVRKALGAVREQLFWQFIAESTLITLTALVIGVLLVVILLPAFNNMADTALSVGFNNGYRIYVFLVIIFLSTTFLAGTYPALFLSGFRPVQVLKGRVSHITGGNIRRSLVIFQFAVSVFFIICTLIVGRQLHYIQHKKLGLDRSQILVLNGGRFNSQKLADFKNRLLQQSEIQQVSASYDSPVSVGGGYGIDQVEGKPVGYSQNITAIPVEKDYLRTMGIILVAGEHLTDADIQDILKEDEQKRVYHFFINETAVNDWGWKPADVIGKRIRMNGRSGVIKGVMKDFHFASMKSKIEPIVVFPEYNWFGEILIKTTGKNDQQVIAGIAATWKDYMPGVPFEYHFLDDDFNGLYKTEFRISTILTTFSTVIILVSCLGLLGLAAFTAEQRTREIGIRKVLGASAANVVALLSKDFIKLVIIALCIASPLAWYAMHSWLAVFAYHTTQPIWIFLLAGVMAIVIALLTVSLQSVKAALMNPVKSLRSE